MADLLRPADGSVEGTGFHSSDHFSQPRFQPWSALGGKSFESILPENFSFQAQSHLLFNQHSPWLFTSFKFSLHQILLPQMLQTLFILCFMKDETFIYFYQFLPWLCLESSPHPTLTLHSQGASCCSLKQACFFQGLQLSFLTGLSPR